MSHAGHDHDRDRYRNPADLEEYLQRLEGKERAEWQQPDQVVAALALRRADTACEIGAGPGYFSLRLARAAGHVFAVEAHPRMIEILRERIAAAGARNVTPVLGLQEDPLLPRASCDLALIVNTFHHFPDGVDYLRRVQHALKPGGRVVNIDFHDRELPVGPPPEQKLSREAFLSIAADSGLRLDREHTFLPWQYFLVLKPAQGA
ncbi:MAG TPA: class I SAM-dependent methyltransferase [Myxococcales bacterium]|nr:class I SAM-dependent methyltransferase [Myxococcales bacterium]HET9752791.1 class I SAM-dependent methyltransferase [Myxococcales bacterium]